MPRSAQGQRLWSRATIWLLFLGPTFFILYGLANEYTAGREDVGQIVFSWEHRIPFWDWSIIPYMSIDLLYAVSLFLCSNRAELDRHSLRLLAATLISVAVFLMFPLQFTFTRPETEGVYGLLYTLLTSLDKPYNQAPSLHISLLILIWVIFNRHTRPSFLKGCMHLWMALIGISVLTTWQHHFIDLVTGLLVAVVLLYLIPARPIDQQPTVPASYRLASYYGSACLLFTLAAIALQGWGYLLLWPATATGLICLSYTGPGCRVFQYRNQNMSRPATLLLLPYLIGARISALCFRFNRPDCNEIVPGIWIGSAPLKADLLHCRAAHCLNLTAEIHTLQRSGPAQTRVPMLDLIAPDQETLNQAINCLETLRQADSPVLVHCALGLSRSATVIAGWLLRSGQSNTVDEALCLIEAKRPGCILSGQHRQRLKQLSSKAEDTSHASP